MKKRMLAALLCIIMILTLLPVTAMAEEGSGVLIGETEIEYGQYYLNNGSGVTSDGAGEDNYNAYLDTDGVLYLKGLEVTDSKASLGQICYAICAIGDLTICVEGENSISVANITKETGSALSVALYVVGNLILKPVESGSGSLKAESKGASVGDSSRCGGVSAKTISVESGAELNGIVSGNVSGNIAFCVGVNTDSINVAGGTLKGKISGTATGNETTSSYGIIAAGEGGLTASSGSVEATGGSVPVDGAKSLGAYIMKGDINVSGGMLTATGGSASGIGTQSIGVFIEKGDAIVSDGKLTATGGSASGNNAQSFGAYLLEGDVSVSGGMLTATGGSATVGSCGIHTLAGSINISGGGLTAKTISDREKSECAALSKALVLEEGITAKASESSDGSNPVEYVGDNFMDYMWVSVPQPSLKITASPSDIVSVGTEVTLTATAVNIPDPIYQWYYYENDDWIPIEVATEATYSPNTDKVGTITYFCTVPEVIESNDITLTVYRSVSSHSNNDYTPSPVTVYNDPSVPDATVWLTGSGLSSSDLLVTERDPKGSAYEALLKLANDDDVFATYNISLRSGKKSTGYAMNLTFDLNSEYAGDDFTLVHQKADAAYEYFYDTADASGDLSFGPLYELSPFMLVKGNLSPAGEENPNTGSDAESVQLLSAVIMAGLVMAVCYVLRQKKKQNG